MLDKLTLLLENARVLKFVNAVRKVYELPELEVLPKAGIYFNASDCPISLAVGDGLSTGSCAWTIRGHNYKLVAAIIQGLAAVDENANVTYNAFYGEYNIPQPNFIAEWIATHDDEMHRLRVAEAAKKQAIWTVDTLPEPGVLDGANLAEEQEPVLS